MLHAGTGYQCLSLQFTVRICPYWFIVSIFETRCLTLALFTFAKCTRGCAGQVPSRSPREIPRNEPQRHFTPAWVPTDVVAPTVLFGTQEEKAALRGDMVHF